MRARAWRVSAALGLQAAVLPPLVCVPIGVIAGPHVTGVLSTSVLDRLDPVVSLALASIGIIMGLAIDARRRDDAVLFAAASLQASTTAAIVTGTVALLARRWVLPLDNPIANVPLVCGLCAAASAAVAAREPDTPRVAKPSRIARVADFDDVAVIAAAAIALAPTLQLLAIGVASAVLVSVAGWMLFERAESDAERGVFVIGAIILLGGIARYLAVSPLMIGMAAGVCWTHLPGRADAIIRQELFRIDRPLVFLLLVFAGAALQPSRLAIWLTAPLLIFRLAGKMIGASLARLTLPAQPPLADVAAHLMPTGLVAIAIAIHFNQLVDGDVGTAVVSAVAITAIVFDLLTPIALGDAAEAAA